MRENLLIANAVSQIKHLKADYGDIRIKDITTEHIKTENCKLTDISKTRSRGAGIRIFVNGAMGFASTSNIENPESIKQTIQLAYDTAIASATFNRKNYREKISLSPKNAVVSSYATKISTDPFTVPYKEKIDLLMACNEVMSQKDILGSEARMDFRREDVTFADTENSCITQTFFQSGGYILARAKEGGQARTYGNILRAGYEVILDLNLPKHSARVAEEAVALSQTEECPSGVFDLVLMPTQLHLQIHESIGHPTELDRVLGSEEALAGASFLSVGDLGLQYASDHVSVVADATDAMDATDATDAMDATGLGTFGFDDEGVPSQRITLIDKGILKNFQTSRDNAPAIGCGSYGMGLADGWESLPIVRMTNINLLPGSYTFDALVSGVKYGFVLEENKSWSIDDKRVNFQFACEIAREIKDGKLTGKIFKNPVYTGKTTEFWNSCDGVCDASYRQMVAIPNCGKGQPMQIMRVSHASQPARFRKVRLI